MKAYRYDAFISFADEDKNYTAKLVNLLQEKGLKIWFSGTELRRKPSDLLDDINKGIANSKYGIAVVSSHYVRKKWTKTELGALFAREPENEKTLIPLWHEITYDELRQELPIICDRFAFETKDGLEETAEKVYQIIREKNRMESPKLIPKTARKLFWQKQKYRLFTFISVALLFISSRFKAILWGILLTVTAVVIYQLASLYQDSLEEKSEVVEEIQNASRKLIKEQLLEEKDTLEKQIDSVQSEKIIPQKEVKIQSNIPKKEIQKTEKIAPTSQSKIEEIVMDSSQNIPEIEIDSTVQNVELEPEDFFEFYQVTLSSKELKNTSIQVKKGQKIEIKASGEVVLSAIPQKSTSNGVNVSPMLNSRKLYSAYPLGILLCRVGDSGRWFPCGKNYEFVTQKSGYLNFKINDMQYGASMGNIQIEVKLSN